jgi:hypothetical protein
VLPWVVAAVAVVLALVAGGVALYALGRAQGAGDGGGTPGIDPTDQATTAAPPTTGDTTDSGRTAEPQLDPRAKYTDAYQQQQLTLHPVSCGVVNVDLDEPRVGVDGSPGDLAFDAGCGGNATFRVLGDGSTASLVTSPQVTPNDCAESIRTGPISAQSPVPVTDSVVMCIATSLNEALNEGITRKIIVLQVRSIAADGAVDVVASAWNVPR